MTHTDDVRAGLKPAPTENKKNIFSKIMNGIAAVAPTVANIAVPGSGTLVEKLMRNVTGDKTSDIEDVAQKISENPMLLAELHRIAADREVALLRIETEGASAQLESVNKTMRGEGQSEHWPQYSWRPFNGFMFPVCVAGIYGLLPAFGKTVPSVPEMVWVGWLAILGVATWDRGKEKRSAAGEQSKGVIESAISAIRGPANNG